MLRCVKWLMPFVLLAVFSLSILARPYQTFYNGNETAVLLGGEFSPGLESGVDYLEFYMGNNYRLDPYETNLIAGIESWEYENSVYGDIYPVQTTVYRDSVCDIDYYTNTMSAASGHQGSLAYTILYIGDGAYAGNNTPIHDISEYPMDSEQDYWGTEIMINVSVLPSNDASLVFSTAAHELGHVMGLFHDDTDPTYIMHYEYEGNVVYPHINEKLVVVQFYALKAGY